VLLTPAPRDAVSASSETHSPTSRRRAALLQLVRFTGIGIVMTLAYLALYAALQGVLGMQLANVVAWLATAVADTAANRRLTFGVSGRGGAARAQAESLLVFATGMVITSGSLLALGVVVATPGEVLQMGVLVGANVVAGLLRFTLLRRWVFAPQRLARRDPGDNGHLHTARTEPSSPPSGHTFMPSRRHRRPRTAARACPWPRCSASST
jgi:putative flippase GtrA